MPPPYRALRPLAVLAAAVAVALTGCGAGVPPAGPAADPPPPGPLAWSDCGPGLECGTLEVPQEYSDPGGPRIALAVMRHRATDPQRRSGTLFFNPGGPGVAATDTLRAMPSTPGAPGTFGPEVLARFDVVAMDPRGVGGSAGVRCRTDAERAEAAADTTADPAIPGGAPLPTLQAQAAALAEGCARHQDPAFLASLSTDNVARDLDRLRAALGERTVTYYGISYGTVVGPMYATLFPDRVRQMVLDAPVDTTLWAGDPLEFLGEVAVASERTLDAWFDACRTEGTAACPFGDDDPAAAFDALVTALERRPAPARAVEGLSPAGVVDGAMLLEVARAAAGDRTLWPVLTTALTTAQQGDGTTAHLLYRSLTVSPFGVPTATQEQHTAVRCADWDTPTDVAAHTAAAERAVEQAPRIGTRAAYSALACAALDAPNTDRVTGPLTGAGAPPTLVVGGRLDPVTPHRWAERMVDTLDSAVLLTREGVGHGSYGTDPCVAAAVGSTLIAATVPPAGTVCTPPPATTRPGAAPVG
ncbi:alpha/beta fold hydrolase [Pseudonocardia sp. ICBG1293]|uniref:alpha/beta fold hydrolase n=1 Tax=Pseudonocardia sp. ICBG1293 TaxID=2844382 RepID=UPI001CCC5FD6|nr:alpha/beta fold hydrolase [Pseudonocardia sp. ICBG1293]